MTVRDNIQELSSFELDHVAGGDCNTNDRGSVIGNTVRDVGDFIRGLIDGFKD